MLKRMLAMVMAAVLALSVCACGGKKEETAKTDNGETVKLKWYISVTEPNGFDEVMEEANKYLKEKINVELDLVCVQPADYNQKMNMIMASQEEFDLMWVASNTFEPNVAKGAFVPLDELLETTPDLKALFKDEVWEAASINGEIYAVPMMQILHTEQGMWFMKSMIDKYDLDMDSVKTIWDLTDIFQTVKDGEDTDFIPTRQSIAGLFMPYMTDLKNGTSLYINDEGKVVEREEEMKKELELMQEWYKRGFFPADVTTLVDENPLIKSQKIFSRFNRILPGTDGKFKNSWGYEVKSIAFTDPIIMRHSVQSTMTVVSATSKHPEKAVQLLELMQTDKYLFNLIAYGLEGRDWTKDPEKENRINREDGAFYVPEYLIGNQLLAYILPNYEDTVWEETEAENEAAPVDPNIGFSIDREPIETELVNLQSAAQGLATPAYSDTSVDDYYAELNKRREAAGVEKVKNEIQQQYDAWKAQQ